MWSQRSHEYGNILIPGSNFTTWNEGCYLCDICSLACTIKNPGEIAKENPRAFKKGLIITEVLANILGMKYYGSVKKQPDGLCIGVTNHFKNLGVPTHFVLCYKDLQADPLDEIMVWKPKVYTCYEYRVFEGIVLNAPKTPPEYSLSALMYFSIPEQIKLLKKAITRAPKELVKSLQKRLDRLLGV